MQQQAAHPGFWDNPSEALETTRRLDQLTEEARAWSTKVQHANDLLEMALLALEQDHTAFLDEVDQAATQLQEDITDHIISMTLSGPDDDDPAIITIQAGAGGAEASLWAEMLLGMYTGWAHRTQRPHQLIDTAYADRGGIRSATLEIMGTKPYGLLKDEAGVHRLVRMSPLDPAGKRHTSFSRVEVLPAVPEQDTANTPPSYEIRFEAFHSSAPGGQHVQKVASAVRLVHIPTGITVTCQTERSQHQNRRYAMRLLMARLQEYHRLRQYEAKRSIRGQPPEPSWGMRTRSYTLQPRQHVIDHRTGHRTGNADAVIAGNIDGLINASLLNPLAKRHIPFAGERLLQTLHD